MAGWKTRPAPSGWFSRLPGDCPVTWTILGANAFTFVFTFMGAGWLLESLVFRTYVFPSAPWSLVTYLLVGSSHPLWLLLGGYMVWIFGGSLERSWGRRDYILFLILTSGTAAIFLWLGSFFTGRATVLAGFWVPLTACVVAWSAINPHERLLLYFVVPIEARWLGILATVLLFFSFPFPLGLFPLAGCGLAWWYARGGRFWLSPGWPSRISLRRRRARIPEDRFTLNPIELVRRWQRKRRFLRLMKQVGLRDLNKH
ncbi:MAG: DUF1751 domain-containing protein [Armatimonadota bacterium]|nr:DUF1751 domain-containing protein [Armatimonadota bacterium]MDR5702527.1 DUF1751 domain-containing protein [Armatimonadota bacterium]